MSCSPVIRGSSRWRLKKRSARLRRGGRRQSLCLTSVARQPVLDSLVPLRGGYRFGHWRDDAGFLARYYAANPMFEAPWTARLLARDLRSVGAGRTLATLRFVGDR